MRFKNVDSVNVVLAKKYREHYWDREIMGVSIAKLVKIGLGKIMNAKRDYANKGMPTPTILMSQPLIDQLLSSDLAQECRANIVGCLLDPSLPHSRIMSISNDINATINQINRLSPNNYN